jgi:type I restriction enzyme S subunit
LKKEYTLSQVAKIDRVPANDEERRRLPYVGLDDIAPEIGRFSEDFKKRPETMLAVKFRFTPQHILYGKLRPYLNKVAIPDFEGVCTTEILPILPDAGTVDQRYLHGLLSAPQFV